MVPGPAGHFIPVQKVRMVYTLESALPGLEDADLRLRMLQRDSGKGEPPLFVSHFETCPDASSHSRKPKEDTRGAS
jgi:hypothetical protein